MKHLFFLLLLLLLLPVFCPGKELSIAIVHKAANVWLTKSSRFRQGGGDDMKPLVKSVQRLIDTNQKEMPLVLAELTPHGYAILTTDTTLPPVIAFSFTANVASLDRQSPFFALLESQGKIFNNILEQPQTRGGEEADEYETLWATLLPDEETTTRGASDDDWDILVAPFMTCLWGQGYPFNLFSPSSRARLESQAVSGCVPTALSQILYHHQWPPRGIGNKTHTDWKLSQLSTLRADFTQDYNWSVMEDTYSTIQTSTVPTESEQAVGRLLSDMGVLCEVDFEENGTGAYIEPLAPRIVKHLHFQTPVYTDSYYNGQQVLYKRIRDDLMTGNPVYLGNHEHAFVTHGLATMQGSFYCYMNYGWNGVDDGWFRLDSVYDQSPVNCAITLLRPLPVPFFRPMDMAQDIHTKLTWDFPRTVKASAFRITAKDADGQAITVDDNIPGTDRQYILPGNLHGTIDFHISAFVDGMWQADSPALRLELSEDAPQDFTTSISCSFVQIKVDSAFNLSVSANKTINKITVSTTRPDIFPDGCAIVTLDGENASIEIRPCFGRCGRTLLHVDIIADDNSKRSHDVLIEVNRNTAIPYWNHALTEAKRLGSSPTSFILMVAGDIGNSETRELIFSHCERDDIKQLLRNKYSLWFADTSSQFIADNPIRGKDWIGFTSNGSQLAKKPVITIISSFMFTHLVANHEGSITADELYEFLNADYSGNTPVVDQTLMNIQGVIGSNLEFKTGGSAPWSVTKSRWYSSPAALQSGAIGDSQSSILMTEVTGTGTISFVWSVKTDYYNELAFYLDGERKASCTGPFPTWKQEEFKISDYAKHTLIWSYVKNRTNLNDDAGWLDDVKWMSEPSHLYSSASSFSLPQEEGSTILDVFTNVPWTATSDVEWLTVAPTSGSGDTQLILSFQANETVRTREALITVTDTEELDLSFTCKVTQESCPPQIAISQTEFQADSDETTLPLGITANCPWIVQSSADWLLSTPAFGGGDESLEITCRENPWCWPREGVLTAMAAANGQQATVSCTVTQDAALPSLSLESGTLSLDFTEGEASLALTAANANWKANCDSNWLTLGQSSGTGPSTISFAFGFNESLEERSCTVTVTLFNDDGEKAQATCIVTQAPGFSQEVLMLKPGWNLLAIPFTPTEEGLTNLLALKPFAMDSQSQSYVQASTLAQGTACWIFSQTTQEILWTAYKTDEWVCPPLPALSWTLLGVPRETPVPENTVVVWGWDGGKFQQHSLSKPLPASKAFWIWCKEKEETTQESTTR